MDTPVRLLALCKVSGAGYAQSIVVIDPACRGGMIAYALAPIAGHHIIGWVIIGLIAGALAGMVVRGGGFGFVRDVVVGLVGAVIGGVLLHVFTGVHVASSFVVELVAAFVGAVILLLIMHAFTGRHSTL